MVIFGANASSWTIQILRDMTFLSTVFVTPPTSTRKAARRYRGPAKVFSRVGYCAIRSMNPPRFTSRGWSSWVNESARVCAGRAPFRPNASVVISTRRRLRVRESLGDVTVDQGGTKKRFARRRPDPSLGVASGELRLVPLELRFEGPSRLRTPRRKCLDRPPLVLDGLPRISALMMR